MKRERISKVILAVIGLLFIAGIYPLIEGLLHPTESGMGDTMMMSLYVTLGVFLLIAVGNPTAHRSVIAFAGWSSFAHAATMVCQSIVIPGERRDLLTAAAAFALIGAVLVALVPMRKVEPRTQAIIT